MSNVELFSILVLTILVISIGSWRRYYFFYKVDKLKTIKNHKRIVFYDFLKGISIISVIIIHAGYFYMIAGKLLEHNLFLSLVNALSRFCIPIFFISSGLLLEPWENIHNKSGYYKKKFLRIFLPYIIIVTMLAIYFKSPLWQYLYLLANGTALVPFYFIIVLLQLYLVYPVLSKYRKRKYFLLTSFLISFFSVIFFDPVTLFGANLFIKFLFFFAYGVKMRDYFLGGHQLKKNELFMWLIIVFIYIFILIFEPDIYYNFRLFYGLAIFNILYYYKNNLIKYFNPYYKFLAQVGRHSLWIFLLHFLIEAQIYNLIISWQLNFYFSFFLIVLFSSIISYLLALLLAPSYNRLIRMFNLN